MQNEIAHRIHAKDGGQVIHVDNIAFGFAHFFSGLQEPGMSENLLRKRKVQCHQKNRPIDGMEANDVLADQMEVRRPPFFEHVVSTGFRVIADTVDVVGECVQPDIDHVSRVKGHRDAPFKRSSGNTEILETRQKKIVHHLVFTGDRLNELRMLVNIVNQTRRIFFHLEEISFFLRRMDFAAANRTSAFFGELRIRIISLAFGAVLAFVRAFVDISLIVQFFENLLYLLLVVGIRGTDKTIIRRVHQIPQTLDNGGRVIHKGFRCGIPRFDGARFNFLAVLVGAG